MQSKKQSQKFTTIVGSNTLPPTSRLSSLFPVNCHKKVQSLRAFISSQCKVAQSGSLNPFVFYIETQEKEKNTAKYLENPLLSTGRPDTFIPLSQTN